MFDQHFPALLTTLNPFEKCFLILSAEEAASGCQPHAAVEGLAVQAGSSGCSVNPRATERVSKMGEKCGEMRDFLSLIYHGFIVFFSGFSHYRVVDKL